MARLLNERPPGGDQRAFNRFNDNNRPQQEPLTAWRSYTASATAASILLRAGGGGDVHTNCTFIRP